MVFIDHNDKFLSITYVFIISFTALFIDSLFQFIFGQIFCSPVSNISNARISSFFGDELIGSYTSRML